MEENVGLVFFCVQNQSMYMCMYHAISLLLLIHEAGESVRKYWNEIELLETATMGKVWTIRRLLSSLCESRDTLTTSYTKGCLQKRSWCCFNLELWSGYQQEWTENVSLLLTVYIAGIRNVLF